MKAIHYDQYGPPDVVRLIETEVPAIKDHQVLIRVRAAALNPLDWRAVRADPFLVRLDGGWRKPKQHRLGADVAGQVEAVGSAVTGFKPGDDVFGEIGAGSLAEYARAPEKHLAHKPANVSFEEAAAVPVAGLTALQGLRDAGKLHSGQKVLINGAAGGVGTFAVQIARALGAEVTGVCSARNVDLVRSLGAAHVVDYARQDFTRTGERYDLILDNVANRLAWQYARALRPGGRCVVAGFSTVGHFLHLLALGPVVSRASGKSIGSMGIAKPNQPDLICLKEMLEAGQIRAAIDRRYPLAQTAEALRYLESKHARAKVVITL